MELILFYISNIQHVLSRKLLVASDKKLIEDIFPQIIRKFIHFFAKKLFLNFLVYKKLSTFSRGSNEKIVIWGP